MKTSINFFFVFLLVFTSCGKGSWEHYAPPIDPNAQTPGDTDPDEEEDEDQGKDPNNLKVITIGINNKNADYGAIVQLINEEEADLVVLREVDKNNTRTGIDINQAEVIATDAGMQYVFAPQLDNYNQGQFGLAVLSKLPIEDFAVTKLPVGPLGGDERPLAYIKVNFQKDLDIAFIGVHLDDGSNQARRDENRVLQSEAILDYIKDFDLPVFVAGNFFFRSEEPDLLPTVLTDALHTVCMPCEPTVTQHGKDFTADHMFFKNLDATQLVDFRLGPTISSRRPAIAEFKIIVD